ncbi:AraC family transcriptional regulator [Rhodococcus sp. Chr-9]|nr:AraC family transcriptional regulator [Rhodococcus sp. Chr-9]KHJ73437.1 AraC family transcriptional regulator [Rhodococcus sp. Chr-9]
MNTFFSSDQVSAPDRVALWHDVICRSYVPLNITLTSEQPFIGTVSTGNLGTVRIATSSSLPQQITRTRRLISQDEREYLMVGVQSAGHALVQQHGRTARVGRGGLVFWDTRHPYDILFPTDWRMSVFQFPRYSFGFTEDFIGRMTAVNVGGDRGIGRVVSSFMTSINDATDAGDLAEVASLHNSAVDLLSAAIRTELADQAAASDGLLECVLAYIRQNLGGIVNTCGSGFVRRPRTLGCRAMVPG